MNNNKCMTLWNIWGGGAQKKETFTRFAAPKGTELP
jgi:hypothetical protein